MNMRKILRILLCLIVAWSLCGCDRETGKTSAGPAKAEGQEANRYAIGECSNTYITFFKNLVDDSGVYANPSAGPLQYYDAETGESMMMCFDPSCEHRWRRKNDSWETTCSALNIGQRMDCLVGINEEGAYYLAASSKGFGNGLELIRTGLDAFEPEVIGEIPWADGMVLSCHLVGDDTVFFSDVIFEDCSNIEENGIVPLGKDCIAEISMVSLKDGKAKQLVRISIPDGEATIAKMACDTTGVYYYLSYTKDGDSIAEIHRYDLSDNKDVLLRTLTNKYIGSFNLNGYIYYEKEEYYSTDVYYSSFTDDDDILLFEKCNGFTGIVMENGVIYCKNGKILGTYDKELGQLSEYPEVSEYSYINLEAAFENRLYMNINTEDGLRFATITMEDYIQGNWGGIKILYDMNDDTEKYYLK